MRERDASEIAYKNGYKQGVKDFSDILIKSSNKGKGHLGNVYHSVSVDTVKKVAKDLGAE